MPKNYWSYKTKKSKGGFTLVEIIVVLVILAILAAVTIPSMLGFVDESKKKSVTNEVRTVYLAAQAYATEQFAMNSDDPDIDAKIKAAIEGTWDSNHVLYAYLKGDAAGTISNVVVQNGKVKSFHYVTADGVATNYPQMDVSISSPTISSTTETTLTPTPTPAPENATFDTGSVVNRKMKILAGNASATYESEDNNIQGFVKATSEQFANSGIDPEDENIDQNILSADGSECKIFAWYANNNIYYYTEANNVYLNSDAGNFFRACRTLTDISGLQSLDVSNTTTLNCIFMGCNNLTNISALSSWDTSNVTNLSFAFHGCALNSLSALSSWKTSNVTTLERTFGHNNVITDLTGLANWDTSKVESLADTFSYSDNLSDITAISGWNVSSVTSVHGIFFRCIALDDATCLNGWNISETVNKGEAFNGGVPAAKNNKRPSWY